MDSTGNAYVTGRTCSADFPTTQAALFLDCAGVYDAFVVKIGPSPQEATEQLIEYVMEMNLQQGIESSLDGKLDAALRVINDLNENNDAAACNNLEAFINAVEAQRGNKIADTQADALISEAQQIIAELCGV